MGILVENLRCSKKLPARGVFATSRQIRFNSAQGVQSSGPLTKLAPGANKRQIRDALDILVLGK